MTPLNHSPLKLRAEDPHDIRVIAACLQDCLLPVTSLDYNPKDKVFTLLGNRFCWEKDPLSHEGKPVYHRVHTGLHVGHVHKIRHQKFNPKDHKKVLNLLTLHADRDGEIHLQFSGGINLCLHIEKILCYLQDLHEPWYTHQAPDHFWHEKMNGAAVAA